MRFVESSRVCTQTFFSESIGIMFGSIFQSETMLMRALAVALRRHPPASHSDFRKYGTPGAVSSDFFEITDAKMNLRDCSFSSARILAA